MSRTRVFLLMAIALKAIARFPFTNFSIRYMVLLKGWDARRILSLIFFFLK